jgi:hypothetical protein
MKSSVIDPSKVKPMTQLEWSQSAELQPMLDMLRQRKLGERKARLFAVAVCRRVWVRLLDARSRRAVETLERFSDRLCSAEELARAALAAEEAITEAPPPGNVERGGVDVALNAVFADLPDVSSRRAEGEEWECPDYITNARDAADAARWIETVSPQSGDQGAVAAAKTEEAAQCQLLRCIAGEPFRPRRTVDPTWLTPEVIGVGRSVYELGTFYRFGELADLLRGAGCTEKDLLDHLTHPGLHAKGCWALDLILGIDGGNQSSR